MAIGNHQGPPPIDPLLLVRLQFPKVPQTLKRASLVRIPVPVGDIQSSNDITPHIQILHRELNMNLMLRLGFCSGFLVGCLFVWVFVCCFVSF